MGVLEQQKILKWRVLEQCGPTDTSPKMNILPNAVIGGDAESELGCYGVRPHGQGVDYGSGM